MTEAQYALRKQHPPALARHYYTFGSEGVGVKREERTSNAPRN
jgi:hypothetical protein